MSVNMSRSSVKKSPDPNALKRQKRREAEKQRSALRRQRTQEARMNKLLEDMNIDPEKTNKKLLQEKQKLEKKQNKEVDEAWLLMAKAKEKMIEAQEDDNMMKELDNILSKFTGGDSIMDKKIGDLAGMSSSIKMGFKGSRKKCKKSQTRNRKSGRCRRKKCSRGKVRDKKTKRCRKRKSPGRPRKK